MHRGSILTSITLLALIALFTLSSSPTAGQAQEAGTITTVAGTGEADFCCDDGPAVRAKLNLPHRVTPDAAGNLLITDLFNQRVRRVNRDGTITTLAGSGEVGMEKGGFAGDGGPATAALLNWPQDALVDPAGNLYIADSGNQRIRKVAPDGTISTIAGSGEFGRGKGAYGGDGGPATAARLNTPVGLAMDAEGNLYIADWNNFRVRKVSPDGIITTFAGNGTKSSGGDGGPAVEAGLINPHGLAVDAQGNVYIADFDDHRVRKVDRNGIITTVAGNGTQGFAGDGGPATQGSLNSPHGVAVDSAGNLFIADYSNYRVRKVAPDGTLSTVAGSGNRIFAASTEEGGLATAVGLRGPFDVAVDAAGALYIADGAFVNNMQDNLGSGERVFRVTGVAAPGLFNGRPFP